MAEQVKIGYQRLFEVRALHHYFLDEGVFDFNTPLPAPDPNDPNYQKEKIEAALKSNLAAYDVRPFLSFTPVPATGQLLRGIHGVFKPTATGFVVAVPAGVEIPADARFEFAVQVQNADFFYYTALTLRRQKIVDIAQDGKTYRYKERVFLFSNQTGAKRTISGRDLLCLSREIPAFAGSAYPAESFTMLGSKLYQAFKDTSLSPPTEWKEIGSKDDFPVFVHQDDVPSLTLPDGSAFKGIELTGDLPDDIFALIQIDAATTNTGFQILDNNKFPLQPCPIFEVHFKNRSTFWRYYNKTTGVFEEALWPIQPLPLVFNGNPTPANEKRKKAPPASLTPEMTGALVNKLYSDIIE